MGVGVLCLRKLEGKKREGSGREEEQERVSEKEYITCINEQHLITHPRQQDRTLTCVS